MANNKSFRRFSLFGVCVSLTVVYTILFNLVQDPLTNILITPGFSIQDFYYLATITLFVIVFSLLLNTILHKLFFGKKSCPQPGNEIISFEWAIVASSAIYYTFIIEQLLNPETFEKVIAFATSFPTAIIFSLGIVSIFVATIRFIEYLFPKVGKFLERIGFTTRKESVSILVSSVIVGVILRFIIDTVLIWYGFPVPMIIQGF